MQDFHFVLISLIVSAKEAEYGGLNFLWLLRKTQSVLGKSLMMSHNFRIYYFLKVLQYHIFLTKL